MTKIVKPLEWELREDGETYHAQSILGRWAYWDGHYLPPEGYGGIASPDPRAAAQADYEQRIMPALTTPPQPEAQEAERYAALIDAMLAEAPWKDQMWSRGALMIAARAIRRGRHATQAEKMENLNRWLEESDEGREEAP